MVIYILCAVWGKGRGGGGGNIIHTERRMHSWLNNTQNVDFLF